MDIRFSLHNSHLTTAQRFAEFDPQLRRLHTQKYIFISDLIKKFPEDIPGVYTLGGGRQIGKTTLLKQWMQQLIQNKRPPKSIGFFTGELIEDSYSLINLLQNFLIEVKAFDIIYIIIDEVTYIKDWDKAIKYAADAGMLENVVLMLSGSDLVLMQEARMRFPGRRGIADNANFHLYPLSFREFIQLKYNKNPLLKKALKNKISPSFITLLFSQFTEYMQHGGYLTAINNLAMHQKILPATLTTYSDWIRGDMIKRGKHELYLREIIGAIIKRYSSQITWNSLAKDLSIDHPNTVADYVQLLSSMDATYIQPALLEDKLVAAPKKARKLMFTDPFIYHALYAWIFPAANPFEQQICQLMNDPTHFSALVEACVITHFRRFYPTYYIKGEGEVDVAYIFNKKFWPVEIKWTQQLHPKDCKQIVKYSNSIIWSKQSNEGLFLGIKTVPLPLGLWLLA